MVLFGLFWWWRRQRLHPRLFGTLLVRTASGEEHQVSLSGQAVALNQGTAGLPGYGQVSAVRAAVGAAQVKLVISYSRDGTAGGRDRGECGPGETVTLGGADFTWSGVPARGRGVADSVPVGP
jgi:hypothetical protein